MCRRSILRDPSELSPVRSNESGDLKDAVRCLGGGTGIFSKDTTISLGKYNP